MSRCKANVLFFDHSNVIQPSPRTREHKASIGKREMSLTMCGCFQLTSEACYTYSEAAHCALMLSRRQTDAAMNPDWILTWMYFAHVCTSNTSRALLLNEVDSVSLSYNYNLCCCCCWKEFFRCQPYFPRRDYCVRNPADRRQIWTADLQWDDRTNSVMSPNKISMVTVTQAARKSFIPAVQ